MDSEDLLPQRWQIVTHLNGGEPGRYLQAEQAIIESRIVPALFDDLFDFEKACIVAGCLGPVAAHIEIKCDRATGRIVHGVGHAVACGDHQIRTHQSHGTGGKHETQCVVEVHMQDHAYVLPDKVSYVSGRGDAARVLPVSGWGTKPERIILRWFRVGRPVDKRIAVGSGGGVLNTGVHLAPPKAIKLYAPVGRATRDIADRDRAATRINVDRTGPEFASISRGEDVRVVAQIDLYSVGSGQDAILEVQNQQELGSVRRCRWIERHDPGVWRRRRRPRVWPDDSSWRDGLDCTNAMGHVLVSRSFPAIECHS